MPHYKNSRLAQNGDPVISKQYNTLYAGILHSINPGCTTCNAQIAYPVMGGMSNCCLTVGDCFHAEDAFAAVQALIPIPAPVAVPEAKCLDTAAAPIVVEQTAAAE